MFRPVHFKYIYVIHNGLHVLLLLFRSFEGVSCGGKKAQLIANMDEPTGAILMPGGKKHDITLKVLQNDKTFTFFLPFTFVCVIAE